MRAESFITPEFPRRNPGEHPVIIETYIKAREMIKDDAIDPRNFTNLYGSENVERDLAEVESLKKRFKYDETQKASDVFEALVYEQIELSDWLGPNVETVRTSEFDDIVNGIDLIAEFNSEDNTSSHLALGVDITFGSGCIEKKFNRIKKEIENDNLATAKYFESHNFKGSLKQLPRVVIGVEKDTVIALAGLWSRQEKQKLATHFVKDVIVQEIEKQLRVFLIYAKSIGSTSAIKSYTKALGIIKSIREAAHQDKPDKSQQDAITNDRVFREIIGQLSKFQIPSR
ncbi:MAG: hypothetical protein K9M10_03880 [Candidatus Pacebacteria bacterium]|nr:hypothetical protein [Candidatus Paceibacterota bacterium]MCF7857589.1 hypothetical protein [Candidatus Paceibacterota bacterium]